MKKGISLIVLVITIVIIVILSVSIIINIVQTNLIKQSDYAVLQNDIAVMQDVLNMELSSMTLDNKEVPVLYTDETYTNVVNDRVWINQDEENIGKVYYKTSREKGCIVFGKKEYAKVKEIIEVATAQNVSVDAINYRYTEQELPTYKNRKLNWYVTNENRIVIEDAILIDEAGTYTMTVNAGAKADWLGLEIKDLEIPEGSKIEFSFETSDDLVTWSESLNNIDNVVDSQYLRVKLTLITNENGKCPSFSRMKVRFRIGDVIADEPVFEGYEEVYYNGQTMYRSKSKNSKITQIIDFKENITDAKSAKISVPVVVGNSTEYLTPENSSVGGAKLTIYVSQDGINWTESSDITGSRYVKVETQADEGVIVGKVEVKSSSKIVTNEWITTNVEYYEADAGNIGEWINIVPDEEIPKGTRIKYTFSKSNDGVNWTSYSENITDNGNSQYLIVKVEFQKIKEEITEEAILNDILINYIVNGNKKSTYLKRPKPPKDIAYTIDETILSIKAVVENSSNILGVQYKINDGDWGEIYGVDEEYIIDTGSKTSIWVAARVVSKDKEITSNPIAKTIELEGLVEITANPTDGYTSSDVKVTLMYPGEKQGYVLQYKIDNGSWNGYTQEVSISKNCTITARMYNSASNDEIAVNSLDISNIDKNAPTNPTELILEERTNTIKVQASGSTDTESGIAGYQYKVNSNSWSSTQSPDTVYTLSNLRANTSYTVYARAVDKSGKASGAISKATYTVNAVAFVSAQGSNGNGSESAPYSTLDAAINAAVDGTRIYLGEGTYNLNSMVCGTYGAAGIFDMGKKIEIVGKNEKTILTYYASNSPKRDGVAIQLSNSGSVIRNLTYLYYPKSGTNYSKAMFRWTLGTVQNVFFRVSGSYKASYLYYNSQPTPNNVINCTFFHDLGGVDSNYSGKCNFTNIATNVATNSVNNNVITASFGSSSTSLQLLINTSKNYSSFNTNKVGVFHGTYAWD